MDKYFYGPQSDMFSFYRVPKVLFQQSDYKDLSAESKILYGLLLDRMDLSAKNNWVDKYGRIYIIFTVEEIMEKLNCGNKKASLLLSELESKGKLIERQRRGLGKPNLIYVLNFIKSEENSGEGHLLKCENDTSASVGRTLQEVSKEHRINTENNDTDINNNHSFYSESGTANESKRTIEQYYEYFRESIDMDCLEKDSSLNQDELHGILDLLVEICSSKRNLIRINREDMPADIVKARLMKLNSEHIRYVLLAIGKNTTRIHDTKQYMLSALFNAPVTMPIYYRNWAAYNGDAGPV